MDKAKKFVEDKILNNKKLWDDVKQDERKINEYKDSYYTWMAGLSQESLLSWALGICFLSEMSSLKLMRDVIEESMKSQDIEEATNIITKEDMHSC